MKKLLAIALIAVLWLVNGPRTEETVTLLEPVGVKVDTAAAVRGSLYSLSATEGRVMAQSEEMSFEINGTVESISIYPGQWVEKGTVLMTLDQTDLVERLADIDEEIAYTLQDGEYTDTIAGIELERMRVELKQMEEISAGYVQIEQKRISIAEKEAAIRQTQESRSLELEALQMKRDTLARNLDRNVITAPFDGNAFYDATVLYEGKGVQQGKTVCYICNPEALTLSVNGYFSQNAIASAVCWARIGGKDYEVVYQPMEQEEMSALVLSGKSLTSRFSFVLPRDEMPEVSAGMYAVLIQEKARLDDVLTLPYGAVYTSNRQSYVYVVKENGGREKRYVKLGRNNGAQVEIIEGLEEGEQVYVKN